MRGWWPVPAACLALLVWWAAAMHYRNDGALREQIKARELTIAALAKQHRTDTLRLVTTRRITDSILSKVQDTVLLVDTVRQIVTRERLACDAVLSTCEQEKRQRDSLIADLKRRRPSRFGCVVGGAGTSKGLGIGAACGLRVTP